MQIYCVSLIMQQNAVIGQWIGIWLHLIKKVARFKEKHGKNSDKEVMMKCSDELSRVKLYVYSELFPEMQSEIIYVNYELGSWKYLNKKIFKPVVN